MFKRPHDPFAFDEPTARRPGAGVRWTIGLLSVLYLAAVAAFWWSVRSISEDWWFTSFLTFAPKLPLLVPAFVLGAASLRWYKPAMPIVLGAAALVGGPIMDFHGGFSSKFSSAPPEGGLRVLSCNVQAFEPDFAQVVREINAVRPHVVVFQEARGTHPEFERSFDDWNQVHVEYFWAASKYPIKIVQRLNCKTFDRLAGLLLEVETPQGPVLVADVHQMTPRHGLSELSVKGVMNGHSEERINAYTEGRAGESAELREQIDQHRGDRPLLVMGDFNTPSFSNLFRRNWGDFQGAFETAGFGYGYTAPCRKQRFWLDDTPWVRIDHILCSPEWRVSQCEIGTSGGSDHRLIWADVELVAGTLTGQATAVVSQK